MIEGDRQVGMGANAEVPLYLFFLGLLRSFNGWLGESVKPIVPHCNKWKEQFPVASTCVSRDMMFSGPGADEGVRRAKIRGRSRSESGIGVNRNTGDGSPHYIAVSHRIFLLYHSYKFKHAVISKPLILSTEHIEDSAAWSLQRLFSSNHD